MKLPPNRARVVAEIIVSAFGVACVALAWRANLRWCERYMIQSFWASTPAVVRKAHLWRIASFVSGIAILGFLRPIVGRWVERRGGREAIATCARYAVAIFFAFGASEVGMRILNLPRLPTIAEVAPELCIAQPDDRYGWVFVGPIAQHIPRDGRVVDYAINRDHNRAKSVDDLPDLSKPTILFAGESITAGFGLEWDETFPAMIGASLDTQIVNLGVHAYGNHQSFARLADALPSFEHPIAIISMYLPSILLRLYSDSHPRMVFDGDTFSLFPAPHPLWKRLHLLQVAADVVTYNPHADETLALAAKIFKRTAELARARGAAIIFVGPRFGDPRGDAYVIDELFTRQGLPFLDVDIGADRLPNDVHPTPVGTKKLADAIIAALAKDGIPSR